MDNGNAVESYMVHIKKVVKNMVMGHILVPLVINMWEGGRMVKNMVMGYLPVPMVVNMWEGTRMVKEMVKEQELTPMVQSITAANG